MSALAVVRSISYVFAVQRERHGLVRLATVEVVDKKDLNLLCHRICSFWIDNLRVEGLRRVPLFHVPCYMQYCSTSESKPLLLEKHKPLGETRGPLEDRKRARFGHRERGQGGRTDASPRRSQMQKHPAVAQGVRFGFVRDRGTPRRPRHRNAAAPRRHPCRRASRRSPRSRASRRSRLRRSDRKPGERRPRAVCSNFSSN